MMRSADALPPPNLSRLKWACRRGMLELDVLLGNFLQQGYPLLSCEEQARFAALLNYSDPELFAWLMGKQPPQDPLMLALIEKIRTHGRNFI